MKHKCQRRGQTSIEFLVLTPQYGDKGGDGGVEEVVVCVIKGTSTVCIKDGIDGGDKIRHH